MSVSPKIPAICSHAYSFHKEGITGKNITVAIMDSGLSPHPELAPHRILHFHDFVYGRTTPYDDYSHGTHVTGIIGAKQIGIAPECNLIALKILDHHGNCSIELFIEAIHWLLTHQYEYNIRIVNMSVGSNPSISRTEQILLNLWVSRLWEAGLIVCCSAGNNGPTRNTITAPGNCEDIITVGSCDGTSFSSISRIPSPKPEVCAPGVRILSLKPGGGYHIKNGTSMSTPFVSGYCALLLQMRPYLTNTEVKQQLIAASAPLSSYPLSIQGAGSVSLSTLLR